MDGQERAGAPQEDGSRALTLFCTGRESWYIIENSEA